MIAFGPFFFGYTQTYTIFMVLFGEICILEFFAKYSIYADVCFGSCDNFIFTIKDMLL